MHRRRYGFIFIRTRQTYSTRKNLETFFVVSSLVDLTPGRIFAFAKVDGIISLSQSLQRNWFRRDAINKKEKEKKKNAASYSKAMTST